MTGLSRWAWQRADAVGPHRRFAPPAAFALRCFPMRSIDFRTTLFLNEGDRERSERAMHYLLHALCCINYEYLLRYGSPRLYESGVRYENERAGKKEWQDIPKTLQRKLGDCKDLACWLVAEDWARGIKSKPYIRYQLRAIPGQPGSRFSVYHVLVQRPGGVLEDPSRRLGMGSEDAFAARRGARQGVGVGAGVGCGAMTGAMTGAIGRAYVRGLARN